MFVDGLGIHLGPLYLRFYGLILVSGAMMAAYLVALEASRRDLDTNFAWDGGAGHPACAVWPGACQSASGARARLG